jgi:hypothetical protein
MAVARRHRFRVAGLHGAFRGVGLNGVGAPAPAQKRRSDMITLIKNLAAKFFYDELFVRRWLRSFLLFAGGAGIAFADQLSQFIESPKAVKYLKIAGVVCAAAGGAVTAGQKNQPTEQPPA